MTRTGMDVAKVLVFETGATMLALPLNQVHRVTPMAALAEPPACPSIVLGVLNLGGTAVPVLRLDRLLGLDECEPGLDSHLLVLAGAQPPLALAVDAVREIHVLAAGALRDAGETTLNDCVISAFEFRNTTAHLLDIDRLLLWQERRRVTELQAMEQARVAATEAP